MLTYEEELQKAKIAGGMESWSDEEFARMYFDEPIVYEHDPSLDEWCAAKIKWLDENGLADTLDNLWKYAEHLERLKDGKTSQE